MNIYKARLLLSQKFPDYNISVPENVLYYPNSDPQFSTRYSITIWSDGDEDLTDLCKCYLTKEELENEVNALIA